jgi:hypothetical protein
MSKFYLTFGQKSPARNGYILIHAESYEAARHTAVENYGQAWSMLYPYSDFDASHFPNGCLRVIRRDYSEALNCNE